MIATEIGMVYCGDPLAFYEWDRERQVRALAWWRAKHPPSKGKPSARVRGDAKARTFWLGDDG